MQDVMYADFCRLVDAELARAASDSPALERPTLFPPDQPPDLLVFVGPRDPAKLRAVRAQLPGHSCLLYFYLPDASGRADAWEGLFKDRTFGCELGPNSACREKLAFLLERLPRRNNVRLIFDSAVEGRLGDWPRALRETIVFTLDNCQQDRTRGLIRLRCSIMNLPAIVANSGLAIRPVPPGTDALVCGAGPSLELQLDAIRAAKGRFLLLAVGHAVPVLLRAGIQPDVVVELDSQAALNWPEDVRPDCILAACSEVAPAVAARFRRVLWFAGASRPFVEGLAGWGLRLPGLAAARTVTASALDLAIRLGCRRVALVGQDLSLGEGNRLHAGAADTVGDEPLLELPGNDGGVVKSTGDFVDLREGLQAFLRAVNSAFAGRSPAPQLFNCTRGGARIEGIARLRLEDFLSGIEPGARPGEFAVAGDPASLFAETPRRLAHELEHAAELHEATAEAAARLLEARADLESKAATGLAAALEKESAFLAQTTVAPWVRPLRLFAEAVAGEMPLQERGGAGRAALERTEARARLQADLSREFAHDFLDASVRMAGETAPGDYALRDHNAFASFRKLALRRIALCNRALAEWMARQPFPAIAPSDRFRARWSNQIAPHIRVLAPDGRWQALTSFWEVAAQARADVEQWQAATRFDPQRHAVLFVAPGTWLHLMEFFRLFPHARAAVIEPWLGLFAALCDYGCFLQALPSNALVVAADDRLPNWRELLDAQFGEWRKTGFELMVFAHPRAGGLPEVKGLLCEYTGTS